MPPRLRDKITARQSPYYSNLIDDVTMTVGTEAVNVITVACQLKDAGGKDLRKRACLHWFISGNANGDDLVAAAPDGGVAAGTDGWLAQLVTGKAGIAVSEADGDLDIAITHAAGAKTVYLGVFLPDGRIKMSGAVTFA